MIPDPLHEVARLCDVVRDLPPAERLAFLDRECAGRESLREQVLELLAVDEQASRQKFLATTPGRAGLLPAWLGLPWGKSSGQGRSEQGSNQHVQVSLVQGSG